MALLLLLLLLLLTVHPTSANWPAAAAAARRSCCRSSCCVIQFLVVSLQAPQVHMRTAGMRRGAANTGVHGPQLLLQLLVGVLEAVSASAVTPAAFNPACNPAV
jgi:hypothetical protein